MDENKNLNTNEEAVEVKAEVENITEAEEKAAKKPKKEKKIKPKKEKLLKNQFAFKKGGYSIAITAAVLIGIIVFNVLVSALSRRFVLEFDMSADKQNSVSQENAEYIKSIDKKVDVIVCAAEDTYAEYVGTTAQQSKGISYDQSSNEYYTQTAKLISKYGSYNDDVNVRFVDPQSSEFSAISAEFSTDNLSYGDIIVTTEKENGTSKTKTVAFDDIYVLQADEQYAAYGMEVNTIVGNNLETALTGAIDYVLSDVDTKVAFLTGHSTEGLADSYKELLETNNYQVTEISDKLVSKIDNDYDIVVIPGANKDFAESEIKVISQFLDNDGKLNKGMIVFADTTAAYLKNFYEFLGEWGVEISDGKLFETDENNHIPDDPTTIGSYNTGTEKDLSDLSFCITGRNVPMKPAFESQGNKTATSIISTLETTVAAPKDATASWDGASEYTKSAYSTLVETVMMTYDDDNNELTSRVSVFSSMDFINSGYNETASVANKELTLAMAERISGKESDISFVYKSISTESFADSVTEGSVNLVRIIFMFILPIAVLVIGVVIFIKRRNA